MQAVFLQSQPEQLLLVYMHTVGYSANYIQQIRREIRLILEAPDRWNSYEEIMDFYAEQFSNKKASTYFPKIRIIKRFDPEGKLPRDHSDAEAGRHRRSSYHQLTLSPAVPKAPAR